MHHFSRFLRRKRARRGAERLLIHALHEEEGGRKEEASALPIPSMQCKLFSGRRKKEWGSLSPVSLSLFGFPPSPLIGLDSISKRALPSPPLPLSTPVRDSFSPTTSLAEKGRREKKGRRKTIRRMRKCSLEVSVFAKEEKGGRGGRRRNAESPFRVRQADVLAFVWRDPMRGAYSVIAK